MMTILSILFWISFAWLVYVFAGYPLLMALLAGLRKHPLKTRPGYLPEVAFVMAAYNEENNIGGRLQNYLELDYPRHLLSFHIGSDNSTDRTDEIIREFQALDPTIHLTRFQRSGKTRIVYQLAEALTADVIIFTDADVLLEPEGVTNLVRCFSDPEVGGVVTRMKHLDDGVGPGTTGERRFLQIEDGLRRNESLFWTTVGPTGPCFAVRRGAYDNMTDYRLSDDLNLAITIPLNGYRVWYEPSVVMYENNRRTLWSEVRRRLRMGQQSAATFTAYPGTRYPWRSLVAFQIWSHKLLRNLAAIPILLCLLCSIPLATGSLFFGAVALFNALWLLALVGGYLCDRYNLNFPLLHYPLYFTAMLASLTIGSMRAAMSGGLEMWSSQRLK
jgi:cellulose synthase/poly-beta-1,6-N-acetylglucosamine synthase-like glycosyltransferase